MVDASSNLSLRPSTPSSYPLPILPPSHLRLWRVDGSIRRFVPGISGRWFSDDPRYILNHYSTLTTVWSFIDLPIDVAENYRYENVRLYPENQDLWGVEGKDFVLPLELSHQRIAIGTLPPPSALLPSAAAFHLSPLPISEITSNIAHVGRVLDWDRITGNVAVIVDVDDNHHTATIRVKNQKRPEREWVTQVVRIRKVEGFSDGTD